MSQWLRVVAALMEDSGSVSNTTQAWELTPSAAPVLEALMLSLALVDDVHMWCTEVHIGKPFIHRNKIK